MEQCISSYSLTRSAPVAGSMRLHPCCSSTPMCAAGTGRACRRGNACAACSSTTTKPVRTLPDHRWPCASPLEALCQAALSSPAVQQETRCITYPAALRLECCYRRVGCSASSHWLGRVSILPSISYGRQHLDPSHPAAGHRRRHRHLLAARVAGPALGVLSEHRAHRGLLRRLRDVPHDDGAPREVPDLDHARRERRPPSASSTHCCLLSPSDLARRSLDSACARTFMGIGITTELTSVRCGLPVAASRLSAAYPSSLSSLQVCGIFVLFLGGAQVLMWWGENLSRP